MENFLNLSLVQLGLSCVHVVNCKKNKNDILGSKWAHVSKFDRPNSQTWPRNSQEWPPDGACGPTFGAHTLLVRRHFFTAFAFVVTAIFNRSEFSDVFADMPGTARSRPPCCQRRRRKERLAKLRLPLATRWTSHPLSKMDKANIKMSFFERRQFSVLVSIIYHAPS